MIYEQQGTAHAGSMREIKFRGKSTVSGEWLTGYAASDLNESYDETMMICGNIYDEDAEK